MTFGALGDLIYIYFKNLKNPLVRGLQSIHQRTDSGACVHYVGRFIDILKYYMINSAVTE